MAWVPFNEQSQTYYDYYVGNSINLFPQGRVGAANGADTDFEIYFDSPIRVRITPVHYRAALYNQGNLYYPARFTLYPEEDANREVVNEAPPYPATNMPSDAGVYEFIPTIETEDRVFGFSYRSTLITGDSMPADDQFEFFIEVWIEEEPPTPPTPPTPQKSSRVYELDKGWSFDGNYIPHFLEMNWYFGDDPFTDKTIQKVRIHGLSKGMAQLQLAVAGMQHDYDSDYTEPQFINIPRTAAHISSEYFPVTNYVDSSNWGVSMQLKFEGSNTDLNRPEPSHVIQVLALQGSPQDNGKRIN